MSQRSHLADSEAWRVVGRLEGGQTQAEVAQAIGVSQSVISRIWNRFLETVEVQADDQDKVVDGQQRPMKRIFIWRDRGSRNNPAFVHERVRFGGGGVLVYGGISIDGRTDLYIIRDGPLTARLYRDEILRPTVVPCAAAIGDDFILMDDNCRPHRANLVEDFLFEEGIVRMEWPACSPDMNPIEHVWDALGRRVAGRQPPPQTLQELERALLEEWDRIPQLVINSLIDSMSHRFAPIRSSQQGKQEERMPFFSFVLPPWMEERYPHLVQNLKINQDRLVTPFDIHATFMTLLNPDVPMQGKLNDRSISLFSEIPSERSCESASIESHWCACLSWFDIPTNDFLAKSVGQAVVTYMNDLTKSQRDKCVELQLGKITRLEKFTPNKDFLTFKKNADPDGRAGEFSDNTKVTEIVYQVQVITYPSEGIYEAIVKYSELDKQYRVKEEEISRVNMYGDQEHCIHDDYPELRKYCYCKEQLTTE
ncbi:uncharacterized protein TNCV_5134981 [Trichonephila clavipes]|nr:uncharacterized protein TNCV_5134981 [Trichonephila clavipes]